jgi:hypothetical protein
MSRRKLPGSPGGDSGYVVGYGKPPIHSRFRAGQSGNPAGRRKGLCNLITDVKRTLETPVRVKEGGRVRTRSTQEVALMVLRQKTFQGDARALDRLLELAVRFNTESAETGTLQPFSADDQAILSTYVAERLAATNTQAEAQPLDEPIAQAAKGAKKSSK